MSLTEAEAAALEWDWGFWGRPEQHEPPGEWSTWLILAGRGFGKTRSGAEWVNSIVRSGRAGRIALVAETAADARDVMIEGKSGILATSPPGWRPSYEPSKRRLTWPNGATATTFNATEPDQLRGPEHDAAWCDELAKWRYAQDCWDQLQMGLRIGTSPRALVTTTPRPIPLIKEMVSSPDTVVTRGRTLDNRANLSRRFIDKMLDRYAGTRLGRQELDAEILEDTPGGFWTRAMLDACRVKSAPELARVVVAIDPSGKGSSDDDADSIGIVVAGKGVDGRGYVLADLTCDGSPAQWGQAAVAAYHRYQADKIVAETNFGGAMVRHVIRTADPNVPFREVHASRGKAIRAEPVAALYEQGRISHVGSLAGLEDQMCQMTAEGYTGGGSPDRLDAMVWALSDLMLGGDFEWHIAG